MLFQNEFSIISVHSLSASGRQLLSDLCKAKNIEREFEEKSGFEKLDHKKQRLLNDSIRRPQNFIKHADSDPNGELEYKEQLTHLILYNACQLYRTLTGELFFEGAVFQSWMFRAYPEDFGREIFLDKEFSGWRQAPEPYDFQAYLNIVVTKR